MVFVSPALVIGIPALIGAVIMVYLFRQFQSGTKSKHPPARPALANIPFAALGGVAAGVLGSAFFMIPLQFCTFDPEFRHTNPNLSFGLGIGIVIFGVIVSIMAFDWLFKRYIYSGQSLDVDTQPGAFKGTLAPILFLLPTMTILIVFIYYPVSETVRLSTLLSRLGTDRTRFECMNNFTRLMVNPQYHYSISISLIITVSIVVLGLALSLLIATMAYRPIKGARIYRILLVWPYALSPVIAGAIFKLLFNPAAGVINHVLDSLFGFKVPWLLDPTIAPFAVIMTAIWNIMGYNILFYIAGLQNVPSDLEEAASIDGANPFQIFFRITFPLLSPITFFLVVTNTTYAFFNTFGLIDFLTAGGPLNSTTTLMYDVYEVGIVNRDLGKGAAQSLVLFLFVIAITIVQFRTSRNTVTYGA